MRLLPFHYYIPTIKGLWKNYLKKEAIYPFYASFKITSKCHFNCPFCNMKKANTEDLSTDGIKKVLDNISHSPVIMTSFEGGEPLLRDDIGELLRYARKCMFYLLFTTSVRNIMDYPLEEYSKYIDFLHISIDEGHGNVDMFDLLPELVKLKTQISIQVVVTKDTVESLEEKVNRCYRAGVNIVIIPATPMNGAKNCFPDSEKLENIVRCLRSKYSGIIHTPDGYFKAFKSQRCSSASIIIAPDGYLYYPCHILENKGPDLKYTDLTIWLGTDEAKKGRMVMRDCKRNCGWYQYYAIDSYISFLTIISSIRPIMRYE